VSDDSGVDSVLDAGSPVGGGGVRWLLGDAPRRDGRDSVDSAG
jgi:hypothetical protein